MLLAAALLSSCGEDEHTDPASLSQALADAAPGEIVHAGAARIEGAFVVPAGVRLVGAGPGATIIVAPAGGTAITMMPGTPATEVHDLTVESDARAAIVARGSGNVAVDNVQVNATRGVAFGAQEVSSLILTNVTLRGPVNAENAASQPTDPAPTDTATHGLVLVRVADAHLTNVTSSGFGLFGALLLDSTTAWSGGGASDNLATGLMVAGGTAMLDRLSLCRTLQGVRLYPAYAGVFAYASTVTTSSLEVCDGQGVGLLHDRSIVSHLDLSAHGNRDAALWVQNTEQFELAGAGSVLEDNVFAGVVVAASSNITIRDARIDRTQTARRILAEAGAVDVGDGIQLVGSVSNVLVSGVTLDSNQRVGLLIDGGGSSIAGVHLESVFVNGTGTELGAIAQTGEIPVGWDMGVTRGGATATNDLSFTGVLDTVGIVAPDRQPPLGAVADMGLDALL